MTLERRPARKQSLPQDEVQLLNTLFDEELYTRVRSLYTAGWTLQAIGDSFDPPRSRTTIRYWCNRRHAPSPLPDLLPAPKYKPVGYVSRRPRSPGIPEETRERIASLAETARRYRAKMNPSSPEAIANSTLTEICLDLYARSVPVRELANAAGVTYRAMARRLGR